ncbi:MAG TPA: hypothetical protein VGE74_30730 [Gemmata sp.]
MKVFGILLIPLILIAGGAYVYFGLQDWKGRQQINAAGFRHLLVLQGLPLDGENFAPDDETPFASDMVGGERTKTVSKQLLTSYFADTTKPPAAPAPATAPGEAAAAPRASLATNEPVVSQSAELKRVHEILKGELGKAPDPAQKVPLVMGWLLLQAESMNERLLYQGLASPTRADGAAKTAEQVAADADQLVHLLDRKFYRVVPKLYESESGPLAPAKWQEAKKKIEEANPAAATELKLPAATDEGSRRDRIAHLLVHLDQDRAWQQRVAAIVGLRRYVHALAAQATRFREMRSQVELPIAADQAAFHLRQDLLLKEARQNVDRARTVAEERAKLVEQKTAADDAVSRRQTQLKDLTAQLEKVKAEVDRLLVQQTGIEKQLYEIQREVGLTLEEVYRFEALLVDVERERYGIPPRTRP